MSICWKSSFRRSVFGNPARDSAAMPWTNQMNPKACDPSCYDMRPSMLTHWGQDQMAAIYIRPFYGHFHVWDGPILLKMSLKFDTKGPTNNDAALTLIMTLSRVGDRKASKLDDSIYPFILLGLIGIKVQSVNPGIEIHNIYRSFTK